MKPVQVESQEIFVSGQGAIKLQDKSHKTAA